MMVKLVIAAVVILLLLVMIVSYKKVGPNQVLFITGAFYAAG